MAKYTFRVHAEYHATIHDETGMIVEEVALGSRTRGEAAVIARTVCREREMADMFHAADRAEKLAQELRRD